MSMWIHVIIIYVVYIWTFPFSDPGVHLQAEYAHQAESATHAP